MSFARPSLNAVAWGSTVTVASGAGGALSKVTSSRPPLVAESENAMT